MSEAPMEALAEPVVDPQPLDQASVLAALKRADVDAGPVDQLKIRYRPYTCPFVDLLKLIEPGSSVYDVGCGSGMLLMLAAEFRSPRRLGGTEIEPGLIDNARSLLSRYAVSADLNVYDGERLPEAIRDYDTVLLIDVLHHVPRVRQDAFLRALAARLGEGARLIVKDIAAESPLVLFNKIHDMVFSGEIGSERRSGEIASILRECGLTEIASDRRRMFVYPHYTLVFERHRGTA